MMVHLLLSALHRIVVVASSAVIQGKKQRNLGVPILQRLVAIKCAYVMTKRR